MTPSLAQISNRLMSMEHLLNSIDGVIMEVVRKEAIPASLVRQNCNMNWPRFLRKSPRRIRAPNYGIAFKINVDCHHLYECLC